MKRMFSLKTICAMLCTVVLLLTSFQFVHAKKTISDANSTLTSVANRSGVSKADVPTVAGEIIQNFLRITTLVFFILIIYAGMRWMLARGNEDEVGTARKTLVMASIGIIVVAGSYAITNFVTSRIVDGQPNDGGLVDFDNADFSSVGCCFDKVRHPGQAGELRATNWSWRITTEYDCKEQGEKPTSFDEIYGGTEWQFHTVSSMKECDQLHKTFCETTDCYDLGF